MHFSFRFIEYAVVGSFFWIIQFAFGMYGGNQHLGFFYGLVDSYTELMNFVTNSLHLDLVKGSIENLLAALSIIMVFATGLLMEMLSSFFIFTEVDVFTRHLKQNDWVTSCVPADHQGIKRDFEALTGQDQGTGFKAWLKRTFSPLLLIRQYKRLYNILFSYVIVHGGSLKLDYMFDQLSVRRTSRGISAAILFLYGQFLVQGQLGFYGYLTALLLFYIAWLNIRHFFGQVCNQLFSLAYVISMAEKSADKGG